MTRLMIGHSGEIALPDELRQRYGLGPDSPLRTIETRNGILLVPLTDRPMSAELAAELAEWQSLGTQSSEAFPFEDGDP